MRFSAKFQGGLKHLRKHQGGWVAFIYFVVSLVLSIVLSPKAPKPKAAALEDFDVPVAEEDRPIPVVFGSKRITGSNVLWYGDLRTTKIKKSSLFSSTTVGYKYYLGLHMGMCHGPVDAMTQIDMGDKVAWTGNVTGNQTIGINQDDLFGGKDREGGVNGNLDVMMGAATQVANTYMTAKTGSPQPGYRGVFGIVWNGGYLGNTPYIKAWAISCRRILKGWQNDAPWYPERAEIGTSMNAAHIVYQCLTDPEWGQGSPSSMIDDDNFRDVADQLFAENMGLNLLWNQSTTIDDFIQIIMDHIAGMLVFDHHTGKYQIRLVRGDYTADTLETFDKSTITDVTKFERRSWGETVNELTITYTDPDTQKATAIVVQDLGNIRSQEARIAQKLDMSGFSDPDVINVVAGRELAARSTPLARMDFTANRRLWRYGPGSVIKFTWPEYQVEQMVIRILSLRRGTLTDGLLTVSAVEDIYALSGMQYLEITPAVPSDPSPPTPPSTDGGPNVLSYAVNNPPSSPSDGDRYFIPKAPAATGDWATHEGQIAEWDADGGEWIFVDVPPGVIIYNEGDDSYFSVTDGADIHPITFGGAGGAIAAKDVTFDDSVTNLGADDVQGAIEKLTALTEGGRLSVRAFAGTLFYAQGTNLAFYDSMDSIDYTEHDSLGQTSLTNLLLHSSRFYAIKGHRLGKSNSADIYGSWTFNEVGVIEWTGLRFLSEYDLFVAFHDAVIKVSTDGLDWDSPVGSAISYEDEVTADAPTVWLRLGDDVNAYRDSAGGYNAAFAPASGGIPGTGFTSNVAGLISSGVCVQFSGVTYIEPRNAGAPINFINGTSDFTIELWVQKYLDAPSGGVCLFSQEKLLAGSGWYSQIYLGYVTSTSTIQLVLRGNDANPSLIGPIQLNLSAAGVPLLFDGAAHHVVATRGAGGRASIYIDGVEVANQASGTVVDLTYATYFAGSIFGNTFGANTIHYNSKMDELAIYTTELSSARVMAHFNAGNVTFSPDFDIIEILWDDTTAQRYLIFGHQPVEISAGVFEYRPRVYQSTDLASIYPLANLAPVPASDSAQIQQVARGNGLIGVMMRKFDLGDDALLAVSANDGETWSFPSISWPTTTPEYGANVLVFDGSKFIAMGRGWSATSTDLADWTFSDGTSGLPDSATFEAFTDGAGITAAAIRNERGLQGTVWTLDGLHWTTVAAVRMTAAEVSFVDPETAGSLNNVQSALEYLLDNQSSDSLTPLSVDTKPNSPNVANDEFEYGSSIDTAGNRFSGATPWSWINQGGASANVINGNLLLKAPAAASFNHRMVIQSISGIWKIRAKIRINSFDTNFSGAGLICRNSTSGRALFFGFNRSGGVRLEGYTMSSASSFNAGIGLATFTAETVINNVPYLYFEMEDTGTQIVLRDSSNGLVFATYATVTKSAYITATGGSINQIGLSANSENSQDVYTICDWFRRLS